MYRTRWGRTRSRWLVRVLAVGVTIVATGAGTVLWSPILASAAGATRYVALSGDDTENDCTDQGNPCATIQYAVSQAAAGDTISLAAGTYPQSARIRTSLTVTGAGSGQTSVAGDGNVSITVDGTDTETPPSVTIESLSVSNNGTDEGIEVRAASVALRDCEVSNNDDNGIELWSGEGAAPATVTISRCSINDNGADGIVVDGDGSAIVDHSTINGNRGGGVIVESGTASVSTSTLDDNSGAGLVADGNGAAVTVTDSTVSNTQPFSDEGSHYGGAVLVFPGGIATVETSTLVGNTGQGVLNSGGQVSVRNSTITGTKPGLDESGEQPLRSGAVVLQSGSEDGPASSLTLSATVLADNTAPSCTGDVTDSGYNLSDTDACGFTAAGSVNSGVAKLAALADNGGPTRTQLPAKGSDAIDAIPAGTAGCEEGATDQRGDARLSGTHCDVGAVEVTQSPIVVTPATLPHGQVGTAYDVTLLATGGLGAPYEFSVPPGALPPGLQLSTAGRITGTPTEAGTFAFTIAIDDPTYQDFVIVVDAPPPTTTTSSGTTSTTVTSSSGTTSATSPSPTSTLAPTSTSSTPPTTSTSPRASSSTSSTPTMTPSTTVIPSTSTSPGPPLADTGVKLAGLAGLGGGTFLLGLLLMVAAGSFRFTRRRRQH